MNQKFVNNKETLFLKEKDFTEQLWVFRGYFRLEYDHINRVVYFSIKKQLLKKLFKKEKQRRRRRSGKDWSYERRKKRRLINRSIKEYFHETVQVTEIPEIECENLPIRTHINPDCYDCTFDYYCKDCLAMLEYDSMYNQDDCYYGYDSDGVYYGSG